MVRIIFLHKIFTALIIAAGLALPAVAQNTSGVFGPTVSEGDRSVQYRVGIDIDGLDGEAAIAQRVHYQHAINGNLRWRVVAQARKTDASDIDYDFFRGELLWQISPDDSKYQTGLRFDARFRDDNRAHQLGANWTNQWTFDNGWRARAIALTSVQYGKNPRDGIRAQTRFNVSKNLGDGASLGVEMFNIYGYTGDIPDFEDQSHSVGPFVSTKLTEDVSIFAGALFGITDASPDNELRLWVSRGF